MNFITLPSPSRVTLDWLAAEHTITQKFLLVPMMRDPKECLDREEEGRDRPRYIDGGCAYDNSSWHWQREVVYK